MRHRSPRWSRGAGGTVQLRYAGVHASLVDRCMLECEPVGQPTEIAKDLGQLGVREIEVRKPLRAIQ